MERAFEDVASLSDTVVEQALQLRDANASLEHRVADRFGLEPCEVETIGYSAILHDVGKMHIPDVVLKKPEPLTPEECRLPDKV